MSENEKRYILPEDLFRLKTLQDARLSPDGNSIVYGISQVNAEKEQETQALWLLSPQSGDNRQLTAGETRDWGAAWSPDGKQIAFMSLREGSPQIYLIPADGGESRVLTAVKQGIGSTPVWSSDGKSIAFTAGPNIEAPDPKKPYRVTRNVYRFDGAGLLDPIVQDIYIVSVEDGESKQLTDDRFHNSSPEISPDGKEVLYLAGMNPDQFFFNQTLNVVTLEGKKRQLLGDDWNVEGAVWMPDGKNILFVGHPMERKIGSKNDLWLISKDGGEPICRSSAFPHSFCGALRGDFPKSWRAMNAPLLIVSKDSKKVYSTVHIGGCVHIYAFTLEDKENFTPCVEVKDRSSVLMDTDERQLVFGVSTLDHPSDLFIADMDGKNEVQLTFLNSEFLDGIKQPLIENYFYKNEDGQDIEAWLMRPEGEGPFPTVLYIHGGPHSAFGYMYSFDYQMLAGAGYAVLFTNPRGSSGYGDDFATAILGRWGDLVFSDLMLGIDDLVDKGIADPDKLGCYGLSYGGYMSCWIVGHTDRFKASVPENPVTNLTSFYGTSDIGHLFSIAEMGGLPHEIPEIYQRESPITYAHKCTTPTLMIQGEADFRCPAEQSEQFYTVLKANGCITEMVRLPGSPHAGTISGPPVVRKYGNEALLDWMDRFVMGKTKTE